MYNSNRHHRDSQMAPSKYTINSYTHTHDIVCTGGKSIYFNYDGKCVIGEWNIKKGAHIKICCSNIIL